MKDSTAIVRLETCDFEAIIAGIQDLSESLVQPAFGYNAGYYNNNPDEKDEWFSLYYSLAAAANNLIWASAAVVSKALLNGDIKLVPGDLGGTPPNKTMDS